MADRILGTNLRRERAGRFLTQEQLAQLVGPDLSQQDISRIERGRPPRHSTHVPRLAAALGISAESLLKAVRR